MIGSLSDFRRRLNAHQYPPPVPLRRDGHAAVQPHRLAEQAIGRVTLDLLPRPFIVVLRGLIHRKSFHDSVFGQRTPDGRTICRERLGGVGNHASDWPGSTYAEAAARTRTTPGGASRLKGRRDPCYTDFWPDGYARGQATGDAETLESDMKLHQFRLRLMMLVMALLAAAFAWLGAVRSRQVAQRAMQRINLEAELRSQERWRNVLRDELKIATSPSHRGAVVAQLPDVEARITELRSQLESDR
jgi:hypothetical protein